MDLYSKDIDKIARETAEKETKPLDPNEDYLHADKVKEGQSHYCISFLPGNNDIKEKIEALRFAYYIFDKQDIGELYEAKQRLDNCTDSLEDDPFQIEKKRVIEDFYVTLLSNYKEFKDEQKGYLDSKMVEHFGKEIEKYPIEGALKVRGVYKNATKAVNKSKDLSKTDGFTVFVGEMGKWMPFNPDKYQLENYETTNKDLNNLMRGHLQEREKAKKSFGLRTELLRRQGAKIAEEIKQKNIEDIKAGMFDGPEYYLQRRITNEDVNLTKIEDWSKDPNETAEVRENEVDLLAGLENKENKPKPSLKNIPVVNI